MNSYQCNHSPKNFPLIMTHISKLIEVSRKVKEKLNTVELVITATSNRSQ